MERNLHEARFAELLEQLREAKRISKTELARLAGLTPGYISHLTLGGRTTPSEETVAALANALQLTGEERTQFFASAGHTGGPRITGPLMEPQLVQRLVADSLASRISWGEAPDVTVFYGRQQELATQESWILNDRCRVITVLGLGGIGKTTLTARLVMQVKNTFDCVFWRSLKDAPLPETVLLECLQFLTNQTIGDISGTEENQFALLLDLVLEGLRTQRCLLIFDNFESILQSEERAGEYRQGYEGYGRLIRLLGEARHRSCLVLTSREKPKEIAVLEGRASLVRSYALRGLDATEGQELVRDRDLFGSDEDWARFIHLYSGNPLALKLISELVHEVFGGDIAAFLSERQTIFGDIQELLAEQFHRLSKLEQIVMYWLAIEREAIALDELYDDIVPQIARRDLLDTLNSLRRRSMIEANGAIHFTLQPVILEYVTALFIENVVHGICSGEPGLFESHALIKAQTRDYIRNGQVYLILRPVIERLLGSFSANELEERLRNLFVQLREMHSTGYAAGNILNLLVEMGCNLRGYDCSQLVIRQAYLQGSVLHNVDFSRSTFEQAVFTDTFGSILSLALSPDGSLLAVGTTNSEVRIWYVASGTPLCTLQGHQDWVRSVAFSPDGSLLASGSDDGTVRLWNVASGQCLNTLPGHTNWVRAVAFSPREPLLASGSDDQIVRLWNVDTGQCLRKLAGHSRRVCAISFSFDGAFLVSGSDDHTLRLWDVQSGDCRNVLQGHSNGVRAVAFSANGQLLASGSDDQTLKLWDIASGACSKTMYGHESRVWSVAFSPDSHQLASGGQDKTVRLWDVESGACVKILSGHTNWVLAVVFSPDGTLLISGSEDQTVRFWETASGLSSRLLQGHTNWIYSVVFSPDSRFLASSEDRLLRLWDVRTGRCVKTLQGHTNWIRCVAYSPDGTLLASGSEDQTVRLWDVSTGDCVRTLPGHTNWVRCVAFSPDSELLATGCDDQQVRLWDVKTGNCIATLAGHTDWIWSIAFSPDGSLLASGGDDREVRLWNVLSRECIEVWRDHGSRIWTLAFSPNGQMLAGGSGGDDQTLWIWEVPTGRSVQTLRGHFNWIRSLAYSPNGKMLASGGQDHLILVWDLESGQILKTLREHTNWIYAVAFSPEGQTLASGSRDGTIKLWDVRPGKSLQTWKSDRPYEGMNISGTQGLSQAQRGMLHALGAIEEQT